LTAGSSIAPIWPLADRSASIGLLSNLRTNLVGENCRSSRLRKFYGVFTILLVLTRLTEMIDHSIGNRVGTATVTQKGGETTLIYKFAMLGMAAAAAVSGASFSALAGA